MSSSILYTMQAWNVTTGAASGYNNDTGLWSPIASNGSFNASTSTLQFRTAGGWDGNRWYVISASGGLHAYTPASNTWQTKLASGSAIITNPLSSHWVMASDGAYIYILSSNNDFRRYDPSTDSITALSTPPGTYGVGMFLTYDGSGSLYCSKGAGTPMTFARYSIANNIWTTLASDDNSTSTNAGSWAAFLMGNLYKIQVDRNSNSLRAYQYVVSGNTWVTKATQSVNSVDTFYTPPSPGGEDSDSSIRIWSCVSNSSTAPSYVYNIISNSWTAGQTAPFSINPTISQGNNYVVTRAFSAAFVWYQSDGVTLLPITVDLGAAVLSQTLTYHAVVQTPVGRAAGVTVSIPVNASTDAEDAVTICATESGSYGTQFTTSALNAGDKFDIFLKVTPTAQQSLGLAKRFALEISAN